MKINGDQIKNIAKLANLPVSEEEMGLYSEQLSAVLEYVNQLNKVDTSGITPIFNITPLENIVRSDIKEDCLTLDEALENASNKKNGYFATKGVFEE